ncbi:plasmid mobilization protein [Paraburkholderia fungorum]|uniref:plasmid mobilization protein n=1 Tax=Paraburkholderia fungorum TaxID=134537 RepID=UPI00402BDF2F
MYIRDESRIYTGQKHSVAFGPLRTFVLSVELRATPRDPYLSEIKMPKRVIEPKSAVVILRVTPETKRSFEEKAADRKLSLTEYLTRAGLGRAARQRADVDAINLLRDCADELRGIHATMKTSGHELEALATEALDEPMRAVIAAINRVWVSGDDQ